MRKFHGFTPLEMAGKRLKQNGFSTINHATQNKSLCYGRSPMPNEDTQVDNSRRPDVMPEADPPPPGGWRTMPKQVCSFGKGDLSLTGFTFVELLIVAALSALVLLALYSGFKSGVLVWQHAQQNNIKQEEIILFTEKLSSELSNSFIFTGIGFKGEASKVSFPALLASTTQEETPVLIHKPGRVLYNWDEENKLVRRLQYDYSRIYQDQEDIPARELVIGITGLTFTYYKYDADAEDYIWSEEWLEEDQLPQAVKVEIKFKDTNDNEKTITRIIPIPNG